MTFFHSFSFLSGLRFPHVPRFDMSYVYDYLNYMYIYLAAVGAKDKYDKQTYCIMKLSLWNISMVVPLLIYVYKTINEIYRHSLGDCGSFICVYMSVCPTYMAYILVNITYKISLYFYLWYAVWLSCIKTTAILFQFSNIPLLMPSMISNFYSFTSFTICDIYNTAVDNYWYRDHMDYEWLCWYVYKNH